VYQAGLSEGFVFSTAIKNVLAPSSSINAYYRRKLARLSRRAGVRARDCSVIFDKGKRIFGGLVEYTKKQE
jgi:hypothetical protein